VSVLAGESHWHYRGQASLTSAASPRRVGSAFALATIFSASSLEFTLNSSPIHRCALVLRQVAPKLVWVRTKE
jgi:hypothetical protein